MVQLNNITSISRNEFELGLNYTGIIVFWAKDSANGTNACTACGFSDRTGLALRVVDGKITNQYLLQNDNVQNVALPVKIGAGEYHVSYYPGGDYVDRVTCCTDFYGLEVVTIDSVASVEIQSVLESSQSLYLDVQDKVDLQKQIDELTTTNTELTEQLAILRAQLAIEQAAQEEVVTEPTLSEVVAQLLQQGGC